MAPKVDALEYLESDFRALDDEFKKLKTEQARMLKDLHDAKIQKFSEVEARVIVIEQKLREGLKGKAR